MKNFVKVMDREGSRFAFIWKFLQISMEKLSIIGVSPSDCLVSYPGHLLGVSYPFAEKQLVYSTALADWAII